MKGLILLPLLLCLMWSNLASATLRSLAEATAMVKNEFASQDVDLYQVVATSENYTLVLEDQSGMTEICKIHKN